MSGNSKTKPFLYLASACDIIISYKNAVHKFPIDSIRDVRLVKGKKMERFYLFSGLCCLSQVLLFYLNNISFINAVSGYIVSQLLLRVFFFQKLTVAYYLYVAKHDEIIRIAINKADKIAAISSVSRFLEIRFAQVGQETTGMYTKAS